MTRYALSWKHDDCGETWEFDSSETYTYEEAAARSLELSDGGSYDVEIKVAS